MAKLVNNLTDFLRHDAGRSWQPGQVDCCLFLASWAVWLGYPDPAQHLRGTYDSEDGFRLIISKAGGVVPLVADCAASIKAKRVHRPSVGAIGVIGSPTNLQRQWGSIFDGQHWLVRTKIGHTAFSAAPLAIWDI